MIKAVAKSVEKFLQDNSPLILTGVGVTGVVTVAYLTGKATFKAADLISAEQYELDLHEKSHPLDTKEKIKLVWKLYIPPAAVGVTTIACVVTANRIGTRRAAAMAAAYSLTEKAFEEYRQKIVEKLGEKKEQEVRDEIAQDQVKRNPAANSNVLVVGKGDVLCYESFSGRYFMSTVENIKKAQNDINYLILNENYASLGDFYDKIGLPGTDYSEEVGWNADHLLEVFFSGTISDDGQPCISISFATAPIRKYYRIF